MQYLLSLQLFLMLVFWIHKDVKCVLTVNLIALTYQMVKSNKFACKHRLDQLGHFLFSLSNIFALSFQSPLLTGKCSIKIHMAATASL